MAQEKVEAHVVGDTDCFLCKSPQFCSVFIWKGGHFEGVVMGGEQVVGSGSVQITYFKQNGCIFRSTKLLMIKPWCYKVPFRAFLIHHLNACLEMCPFVLLSKYLMRLVLNF